MASIFAALAIFMAFAASATVLERGVATSTSKFATPAQTPPAATYTIPAKLQGLLNHSAQVTIVNSGDDYKPSLEWTALGDSYAAGVGTSDYVDGLRCLRYDEAYPILMNLNPEYAPGGDEIFPPGPHKLNNVVCSGAETQDILDWQLLDEPTYWKPNPTFGNRPAFGSPQFATLTAGGDDIDFPGILFNCILGVHIKGGPTHRSCTEQRAYTWSLLNDKGNDGYIANLGKVINEIMAKGQRQGGTKGADFRLYVTGYGRFFNAETTGSATNCDGTTFQIDGLWGSKPLGPDGARDARLTQDVRRDFNNMADSLNKGIQQAVHNYNQANPSKHPLVKYVDIQSDQNGKDLLAGHRFCEPHIEEPDTGNSQLYFWHYPYAGSPGASQSSISSHDPFEAVFNAAYKKTWDDASPNVTVKYPKYNKFLNAVISNITPDLFLANNISDWNDPSVWGGSLGYRTRVFHPQFNWHSMITTAVLAQYLLDHTAGTVNTNSPTLSPSTMPVTRTVSTKSATSTASSAIPTETCHTNYDAVYDSFSIRGANWDKAKLDGDGSTGSGKGLHTQLSGCAVVTDWKFQTETPTAGSPWTFSASGHITIWQKTCVEHAIVSAGAPEGKCSGSG